MNKITRTEFAKLFALLTSTYEWFESDDKAKTKVWYGFLCDINKELLSAVVNEWIATEEKQPTIADLRNRCAVKVLDIPTALEAWQTVAEIYLYNGSAVTLHEITCNALESIGGGWAVKTSESPSIIRSQFMKTYQVMADKLIKSKNINHELNQPPKKELQDGETKGRYLNQDSDDLEF